MEFPTRGKRGGEVSKGSIESGSFVKRFWSKKDAKSVAPASGRERKKGQLGTLETGLVTPGRLKFEMGQNVLKPRAFWFEEKVKWFIVVEAIGRANRELLMG